MKAYWPKISLLVGWLTQHADQAGTETSDLRQETVSAGTRLLDAPLYLEFLGAEEHRRRSTGVLLLQVIVVVIVAAREGHEMPSLRVETDRDGAMQILMRRRVSPPLMALTGLLRKMSWRRCRRAISTFPQWG